LAKRPRFSRWRRLPPVFRTGEHKLPDPNIEPQRLSLYLPWEVLDAAEQQAARAGAETVQDYCTELLRRAIEAEQVREHVADVEARRGPLEGLHQIADDPEYLAEWSAQAVLRDQAEPAPEGDAAAVEDVAVEIPGIDPDIVFGPVEAVEGASIGIEPNAEAKAGPMPGPEAASAVVESMKPVREDKAIDPIGQAAEIVLRHAGQAGDDPQAFLACLRRGEAVAIGMVAELARALNALEAEYRDSRSLDRRVAFALHRLAYEGQILHTDAWPGSFDEWTVDTLRAVQESVERILSGQDIRYYPTATRPE
jgi:hypothetical protein